MFLFLKNAYSSNKNMEWDSKITTPEENHCLHPVKQLLADFHI